MSQTPARSGVVVLAVVLCGFAAASRPLAGQRPAPAEASAAAGQAPAFAATLIGDESGEEPFRGAAVAVDADNTVIVVGRTGSTRFPATGGAIKRAVTGASDVFVARFDAGLKTLLAATLVGGSGDEGDCAVALGPQGDIYIAGSTTSNDFPPGAAMLDSGSDDAKSRTFVARISRDLSALLSAAVLSRESAPRTGATRVVFDRRRERVLVGGTTASAAFPVTPGAFQARLGSDQGAKFVAILDPGLTRLVASTLLGGSAREGAVNGLLTDSAGHIIVGGSTFSTDYPTTGRAFKRAVGPGQVWGAVSKLSPDLTALVASTFVGEVGNDFVYSIALDRRDHVVFAGHVFETMPTTPNAYLRTSRGIPDMANVGILSSDLSTLVASTFVCGGGEGSYYGGYSYFGGLAVGGDGSIFVAGTSDVLFFPTTPGAFDDTQNGARDVVVIRMNADLSSLEASTFIGGRGRDLFGDIVLDPAGHVVIAGATSSSDFPASAGAFQPSLAGRQATYVARFGRDLADPERLPAHAAAGSGDLAELKALAGGGGADLRRLDRYGRLPLHWAARYGRLDAVRWLVEQGADPNAQDGDGNTPLHLAGLRGELGAADLLRSLGAAIDRPNKAGDAPLHLASLAGHEAVVRHFVARKAGLDVKNGLGNTPLHRAAFSRHREVVAALLAGGANPSLKNDAGNNPLHLAVMVYRNADSVALLVKAGAAIDDVNAKRQTPLHAAAGYSWQANAIELLKARPAVNRQDADGRTPLHQAVSGDLRETVRALLAQGADPSIRDAKGKSALDLAEEARMTPMVELLRGAVKLPHASAKGAFDAVTAKDQPKVETLVDADPQLLRARDGSGRTLLHRACQGLHLETVKSLIRRGADVNARDNDGTAPLHILASEAHEEGVALLVANKAEVNAADAQGNTPLIFAAQSGSFPIARQLIDHGAAAAGASHFGYTPLLRAIESNSLDIVELLIASGADPNRVFREDYYGDTPLSFAIKNGRLDIVKSLHRKGADLHYQTKLGASLLHFAAAANKAEVAAYLIDGGVDVDSAQNGGLTPLHLAAITGGLDAAKLLVDRGAALDVRSKDGATPLHLAVAARNTAIADLLRRSGATEAPRAFPRFAGKYLGQKAPGSEPEPFVPELFRDIYRSYSAMIFSPDGKEVFWTGYFMPGVGYQRVWWMREVNGIWTAPELAPFSDFQSWQPMLSHDGRKIHFASDRPRPGETAFRVDLWYAVKDEAGAWGPAEYLGSPPNRDAYNEMLPSPARDGTIYFKAFGPGARGTGIYKSTLVKGVYQEPISIDDLIEANGRDDCADTEHLITYSFGDPSGVAISIAFHRPDGRWTRPVHMGDVVHRGQGTIDGRVSPDGRAFFFAQNITPHWVDASFIEDLRREALKAGR